MGTASNRGTGTTRSGRTYTTRKRKKNPSRKLFKTAADGIREDAEFDSADLSDTTPEPLCSSSSDEGESDAEPEPEPVPVRELLKSGAVAALSEKPSTDPPETSEPSSSSTSEGEAGSESGTECGEEKKEASAEDHSSPPPAAKKKRKRANRGFRSRGKGASHKKGAAPRTRSVLAGPLLEIDRPKTEAATQRQARAEELLAGCEDEILNLPIDDVIDERGRLLSIGKKRLAVYLAAVTVANDYEMETACHLAEQYTGLPARTIRRYYHQFKASKFQFHWSLRVKHPKMVWRLADPTLRTFVQDHVRRWIKAGKGKRKMTTATFTWWINRVLMDLPLSRRPPRKWRQRRRRQMGPCMQRRQGQEERMPHPRKRRSNPPNHHFPPLHPWQPKWKRQFSALPSTGAGRAASGGYGRLARHPLQSSHVLTWTRTAPSPAASVISDCATAPAATVALRCASAQMRVRGRKKKLCCSQRKQKKCLKTKLYQMYQIKNKRKGVECVPTLVAGYPVSEMVPLCLAEHAQRLESPDEHFLSSRPVAFLVKVPTRQKKTKKNVSSKNAEKLMGNGPRRDMSIAAILASSEQNSRSYASPQCGQD